MLAFISLRVSNKPERVGFNPILGTSTSDPSVIKAAQTGKAALEGSLGTFISCGNNSGYPFTVIICPLLVVSVSTSAPKPCSILSVWSLVFSFSITIVSPAVFKPAKSIADLICAEATGV